MSRSHKKKRNVGLIYEFLIRKISESLVNGDTKTSSVALKILKKHFKQGTELYKEFRIINALRKSTVSSEAVAAGILQEAKNAVRSHDLKTLEKQKTSLIHDINYNIKDENFFDQQVSEYRLLATMQTLFNDWRDRDSDLQRMASYEDQIVKHLVSEKAQPADYVIAERSVGEGRLLMKMMSKKLNEKYSGVLTDKQKSLLKAYAFSTVNDDPELMKLKLHEMRDELLKSIKLFESKNKDNTHVDTKLTEVKQQLLSESIETINDETVTRFMLYSQLTSELAEENDDV